MSEDIQTVEVDSLVEVRSPTRRELVVRLMPWGRVIDTVAGTEEFARGAFDDALPANVRLMGLEHEAQLGIGQGGKPVLTRPPVGKAIELESREDGQYGVFRVSKTQRGDELLALAEDGVVSGISVEFSEVPGGTRVSTRAGRRHRIHDRVRLMGASTTWQPAYPEAAVLTVRSEGGSIVAEAITSNEAPAAPVVDMTTFNQAAESMAASSAAIASAAQARSDSETRILERLDAIETQARSAFAVPVPSDDDKYPSDFTRGDWMKLVLRSFSGERIPQGEIDVRVAADLITTDNIGVVPPAYLDEIIGIIDQARPFLASTRRLALPPSGMSLIVPKITTRPTVGIQSPEKEELVSTATAISTETFNSVTVGGYGDISLQLLRRSDPAFLGLYVDLLGEALAAKADDLAVNALLNETEVVEGGTIVPGDGPQFGDAWANAAAVSRLMSPDTIWLSSSAVAAFIDAQSTTTNMPLYANIQGNFTAAGGIGGTISGLRPVHVPALEDEEADIIVGPSRGFAWTEDGTITLQVDVPAKAGRDVALVSTFWFAPLYPAAFTSYVLGS